MLLCAASWQGSRNSLRDFLLVRGCQLLQLPTSFWGKGTYELNLLLVSSVHGVGSPVVGFVVAVLVVEIGGLLPLVGAAAIVARSRYGCGLSDSGRGEGGEGLGFGVSAGGRRCRRGVVAIGVGRCSVDRWWETEACLGTIDRGTRRLKELVHGPRGLLVWPITIRTLRDRGQVLVPWPSSWAGAFPSSSRLRINQRKVSTAD